MNLAIDIGNTRIKAGVFDGDVLVASQVIEMLEYEGVVDFGREHAVQNVIVCSVNDTVVDGNLDFSEISGVVLELNERTKIPVENGYETPATLGKDRLAAAIGGYSLFKETNVLIIDAGTCVTIDLVTADAKYIGGNISPGLDMRLNAMHEFTSRLPLAERGMADDLMGRTTDEALKNGATQGIILEIEGYIRHLRKEYMPLETVITGGDGRYFADLMKTKIFVRSNLVLIGLNEILKVNVARHN